MSNNKNVKNSEEVTLDDIFKLVDLYYNKRFIIYSHHYNSYNKLLDEYVPNFLLYENHEFYTHITPKYTYKYYFKFENIRIAPPTIETTNNIMYPKDARDKNLTYASKIIAKVSQFQDIEDSITKQIISTKQIGEADNNVTIGVVPIMVKSKYCSLNLYPSVEQNKYECDFDPGCYYIINGSEKV